MLLLFSRGSKSKEASFRGVVATALIDTKSSRPR